MELLLSTENDIRTKLIDNFLTSTKYTNMLPLSILMFPQNNTNNCYKFFDWYCLFPPFIEFIKQYVVKSGFVVNIAHNAEASAEFFETVELFKNTDGEIHEYFYCTMMDYILFLKNADKGVVSIFSNTLCKNNVYCEETYIMRRDEMFRHIYFCSYPPYVELHQLYKKRRWFIATIHDEVNKSYVDCLAEHVFADSFIIFSIVRFL